jgi:hypothetical protein
MMHQFITHATAKEMFQRAGYPRELIAEVLTQLPDPIDFDRDGQTLMQFGITVSALTDRMGASP